MANLLNLVVAVAVALPGAGTLLPQEPPQVGQSPFHVHEGELGETYLAIERALKCNCGCNLDVHSCQYTMQCGTSPEWSRRIRSELEQGMSPEVIKAGFVAEFGPTVLMAPPAEGFNLLGYLLPGVAILTAGLFVGLLIRGNGQRREQLTVARELSPEEIARLKAELRQLEAEEDQAW